MSGTKAEGDGIIRTDFPGGWAGDPKDAFTLRDVRICRIKLGII